MIPAMLTTILTIAAGFIYCVAMFLLGVVLVTWFLDDKRK